MHLRTNRVVVTFTHSDGSFAEASQRAVRVMAEGPHKGQLCIERRKRLLPITVTGTNTASCNLAAAPFAQGYAEAQAVAPVATLAQLGITREPKAAKEPKAPASAPAAAMAAYVAPKRGKAHKSAKAPEPKAQVAAAEPSLEDAIAAVRAHMAGKPLGEVQAIMTSLVTVKDAPKGRRR